MLIKDLNKMEKIVNSNSNLSWSGWDVIHLEKSNTAMFKTNGYFLNGSWYIKTSYSPNRDGWNIKQKHLDA